MNKRQLTTAIKLIRDTQRHIQPDGAWILRTRHDLLKMARREAQRSARPSLLERVKAFVLAFVPRRTVDWVRGPVMAALSVAGMVLGGSLASVSAAEQSVPGDVLYPVKLAAEQARILMQKEEPEKLRLKTVFVSRRAEEIKKIANTPEVSKRTERIKEAADIMKKDLDAVKTQLHAVANESPTMEAIEVAKEIDKASGEAAQTVKDVRDLVPDEARAQVVEAQVAAVSTSVKAVQVLIEKYDDPDGQQSVSTDDIKRSVERRVQGLQEGIEDATKKVAEIQSAAPPTISQTSAGITTTTAALALEELKEPLNQLKAAQSSLEVTKKLLEEEKMQEVKEQLTEAVKALGVAEKSVATAVKDQQVAQANEPATAQPAAASSASTTAPILASEGVSSTSAQTSATTTKATSTQTTSKP